MQFKLLKIEKRGRSIDIIFLDFYQCLYEELNLLMCKSVSRIQLTALLLKIKILTHQKVLMHKLIFLEVKYFMDNFSITINVEDSVFIKLLLGHHARFNFYR